ncbi:MAG: MBL fold metallo-hydrolase [Butyricicoccus pullicaecorum]|nr:MBL fold metallo-hydrolase [Butyricicoccus pullicaecorum]
MEQNCYYSIASGSSGNCGLYIAGNTRILIDLGVSVRRLTAALRRLGLTIEMLDAVLLTHEHIDHVKGLATFAKRHTVPVYATKGTAEALLTKNPDAKKLLRSYWGGETFTIGTVDVQSFLTPHDAAESVGYILRTHRHTFGFATDLGFVPSAVEKLLLDCDAVVLESNHDLDMLRMGPYPWPLKQRVGGSHGHLSNPDCAACAVKLAEHGVHTILLAHLSEHNNTPVTALRETRAALDAAGLACEVYVAPKDEMEQPIRFQLEVQAC